MDKKNFTILLISTVVAAFLGAFIASFVVLKEHRQPRLVPFVSAGVQPPISYDEQEKIMEQQEKFFNKFDSDFDDIIKHSPAKAGFIYMNNSGLKTEETKDQYKIIVDLKPFNNDEKNVDVKVNGRTVSISADYKSKENHEFSSSQFHQTLMLPQKIDESAVKKERKGDSLIITIPKQVQK